MTNILLNYYNFDGEWTEGKLEKYFRGKKVLILPLAFRDCQAWDNESFLSVYGKGGEKYYSILRPFLSYGLNEEDVSWLNPFDRTSNFHQQIASADVLFFTGGMPEKALQRLQELEIAQDVKNFGGVVSGASAGAMLQLDRYHVTPDDDYDHYQLWNGLGLVSGIDLEVHYLSTPIQNQCTMRAINDLQRPVYQIWHEGGLLVENGEVTMLGKVKKIEK